MRHIAITIATITSLLLIPVIGLAGPRVVIDHVSFDDQLMELTVYADVLDSDGLPVEKLEAESLELLASGEAFKVKSVDIETAQESGESVAVTVLMNGSNAYQVQGESELHSTFDQEKQGVAEFIKRLKGTDKISVIMYREGSPHEIVYAFASDFKQAQEAASGASIPDADFDPEMIGGAKAKKRSLSPEVLRAVEKSLGYMVDNLDKLDAARRKFLIVMSDGKDRETRKSRLSRKIDRILEKYEEYKIRIHAIGYTADDPQYLSLLQTLANGTGGHYVRIDTKDFVRIPEVWDNLAQRIKKQYVLKFSLEELPSNGKPVKGKDLATYVIKLKVKTKDGAINEAQYNDVRLPLKGFDWMMIVWILLGILGAVIGVVILIVIIKVISGGRGGGHEEEYQEEYDGPDRGKLMLTAGPLAGTIFPLIDDVTTIGSMKGNSLVIQDGSVSRRHAAIKIDQMRYEVADMNSTNGVLVNGGRIHKVFLKNGDKITIGTTEIEFRLK
jgi:hypothetical protein